MKKNTIILLVSILTLSIFSCQTNSPKNLQDFGYTLLVEGQDWGPVARKVILPQGETVNSVNPKDFSVVAKRSTPCAELDSNQATGARKVLEAYASDAEGTKKTEGKHITLVLEISPKLPLSSPMQYFHNDKCQGSKWMDYQLSITNKATKQVWDKEIKRIHPIVDQFDLSGKFEFNDSITLHYASFAPKPGSEKSPLIIWLHGGGEGGIDPTVPLMANKASNYASSEIQEYFGGAFVLVPQSPTRWMHGVDREYTWGEVNDIYNEGLMALIKDFVAANPKIDENRIYVGGCSNGGYMTLKLLLENPDYFAAAYPSALAYKSEFITDEQIESIAHIPIWFIHSEDDTTTPPLETVVPVYERLMAAGAKNVHFSYYKHVYDITGLYGGEDHHYNGHLSWIYSHANHCTLDYNGEPVLLNEKPTTVMEWMAAQAK